MRYVQIMIIVFRNVCEIQKILKYNHGEKSMKFPCVIYADLECLLEKMSPYLNNHDLESLLERMILYQNDPDKSYTEKKYKHTPSGCSLFTQCSFDSTKNKPEWCISKYCMKGFYQD